ncbi:hypothetical protein BEL04_07390 [Mucilaginibacter sp. PPCGB 2223]|uniref:hypothetical protein n=1 Tax=Mucilaginibacter sp. PPCGB 2223 TaxID=1886027 RepID=UPI0008259DD7|nr:hypothetical protein [Mucilaginibacter sp. PPCGB 2223]OCX54085.1 hypothetical protein BEL04_07390 [Mucilaginibacter sp. PPCGB 2223]
MSQDDELNKMFREVLTEPGHHAEYREADWEALEKMLDEREKKRGIIVLLPYIGAVAAVLLVFFAWMFFKPAATDEQGKPSFAVSKPQQNGTIGGDKAQQTRPAGQQATANINSNGASAAAGGIVEQPGAKQPAKNQSGTQGTVTATSINPAAIASNKHPRKGNRPIAPIKNEPESITAANKPPKVNTESTATDKPGTTNNTDVIAANKPEQNNTATAFSNKTFEVSKPETVRGGVANPDSAAVEAKETPQIAKQIPKTGVKATSTLAGTHFALTILAAPDINGVGSFAETQTGANFGLLFSVGRGRFTLSTGVVYAKATYGTDFSNYHTGYYFTYKPQYVNADCRILDIPLDLNYRLFGNVKNQFSIGAGLSSYLMLKENYFYDYGAAGITGPAGYQVSNRNKHYFGVADLNVLYQHRLSSKFSLGLQPYLQLPLTDIGYGKVKLQSAGMAVGFSWNIK